MHLPLIPLSLGGQCFVVKFVQNTRLASSDALLTEHLFPAGGGLRVERARVQAKPLARKENYYLYNTNLQPFANQLRKRMTKAEACLWKYTLRASQMKGYGFRRQRPVLNYIADFKCKELFLIIEVDRITHQDEGVIENENTSRPPRDCRVYYTLLY
jgi:hypothetical protein